ncbi:MAG: GNAT family N-acetyltransferase [Alphaproteobacteria bacterium]|nr:GNAT family N-acetyltransferase [Alphaproteobacteria bacterium]
MTDAALAAPLAGLPATAPGFEPGARLTIGAYTIRFAETAEDLRAVQRLRFEVFNLELNEGLQESFRTGLDEDMFDTGCCHVMVIDDRAGEVVGTYRLRTFEMAVEDGGFYSAGEFRLGQLPEDVLRRGLEVGRACVAGGHRSGRVIALLWKALGRFMVVNHKRYLFGCCSLTGQDPTLGAQVYEHLAAAGRMHPLWRVEPLDALPRVPVDADQTAPRLPPLFEGYMRLGAHVCGWPAIDPLFDTTDFLVVLDLDVLTEQARKRFLDDRGWSAP